MGMTESPLIEGELQLSEEYTTSDLIVEYLHQLGVEYVFGVPGGAIEPLYNALARSARKGGPRAIVARHESGAAFMADGYARETGKIGVVCATTGPGATNLITGVANALADNVPLLVITAQTPLPKFGKGALQDSSCAAIDTVGMFRHCTRFNTLVSHPETAGKQADLGFDGNPPDPQRAGPYQYSVGHPAFAFANQPPMSGPKPCCMTLPLKTRQHWTNSMMN